jgi:taurine dioxygenase
MLREQTIVVRPLTAVIGAEVSGVDLGEPLVDDTFEQIHEALLSHLVLLFRNQDITPEAQLAFGERFGPVTRSTGRRSADVLAGVSVLDQVRPRNQGNDTWHSDHMFTPVPPMGTVLRAVQVPEVGGDTCFASMYAAYDALSPSMQRMLDELYAWNSPARIVARVKDLGIYENDFEREVSPPVLQPVVRVHPETGRKSLFVCENFTNRIEGLTELESDALLAMLFEHCKSPHFQCRVRWEPNSLAFWDNRCTQHCAVPDYDVRRVMHRSMIGGDVAVGPNGPAPS